MKKILTAVAASAAAVMLTAAPAIAAVSFDAETGTGFVGKGDVQTALGLNNAQVQSATLSFTAETVTASETTWVCFNQNNEHTQERARTTTVTVSGVVSSVARVKNQITGFHLEGYTTSTSTSTTEGPAIGSCPNPNSSFVLEGSISTGDPVVLSGGLKVNGVPLS